MPRPVANNAMARPARLTGEDGLVDAARVQLARRAGRREAVAELGIGADGGAEGGFVVPVLWSVTSMLDVRSG